MRYWLTLLLCLLLVLGIFVLTGLREHISTIASINKLGQERRGEAEKEFFGEGKSDNVFAGSLAYAWNSGVWVWQDWDIKYYHFDSETIYSYYQICKTFFDEEKIGKSGAFVVGDEARVVTQNFEHWNNGIRKGDFVQGFLVNKDMEGSQGAVREIMSYDVPLFLNVNIEEQCEL